MTTRLLRSVIGLALTSAVLSIIMFSLNSPLAAVFELSVCAGLISVIFITTISFTKRLSKEKFQERQKERISKYWFLPLIVLIAGVILSRFAIAQIKLPQAVAGQDARNVLWQMRHLDLLGQVVILLAGAFGVVILFKSAPSAGREPKK